MRNLASVRDRELWRNLAIMWGKVDGATRSSSCKVRTERREDSQSPLAEGAKVGRCLGFFCGREGLKKWRIPQTAQ